jgi:hypothetical protein
MRAGDCQSIVATWRSFGSPYVFQPDGTWFIGGFDTPPGRGTWKVIDVGAFEFRDERSGRTFVARLASGGNQLQVQGPDGVNTMARNPALPGCESTAQR